MNVNLYFSSLFILSFTVFNFWLITFYLLEHSHDFIRGKNSRREEKQRREDLINKRKKTLDIFHYLFLSDCIGMYIYLYICVYDREEHDKKKYLFYIIGILYIIKHKSF